MCRGIVLESLGWCHVEVCAVGFTEFGFAVLVIGPVHKIGFGTSLLSPGFESIVVATLNRNNYLIC